MTTRMKIIPALLLLLVFAFIALSGCSTKNGTQQAPDAPDSAATETDATEIGTGSTVFTFEVTDGDGEVTVWKVSTDETTVGAALLDAGLIQGDVSDFGLMVTHVGGLRGDYTEDGYWWAFMINGEMAQAGVDATEIETGNVYAFVYTPA